MELSKFHAEGGSDLTEAIAHELMQRIADVTPVLGVPLVARTVMQAGQISRADLEASVTREIQFLTERRLPCPRRKPDEVVKDALSRLRGRKLITESDDAISATPLGEPILTFYANSIAHHFNAGAAENEEIAAAAE